MVARHWVRRLAEVSLVIDIVARPAEDARRLLDARISSQRPVREELVRADDGSWAPKRGGVETGIRELAQRPGGGGLRGDDISAEEQRGDGGDAQLHVA